MKLAPRVNLKNETKTLDWITKKYTAGYKNINEVNSRALKESRKPNGSQDSNLFFEIQTEKWLTTKEAADFMRISAKCLLNLTSNGRVPYYKFGRRNRFLLSDLHKLLLEQPRGVKYGN